MTQKPSTTIRSAKFSSDSQKIRFVGRYFRLFSDILATEFEIIRDKEAEDMKAAFLVAPADVCQWTDGIGAQPAIPESIDLNWAEQLLGDAERWRRQSRPCVAIRPESGALIATYQREGIVLKRIIRSNSE